VQAESDIHLCIRFKSLDSSTLTYDWLKELHSGIHVHAVTEDVLAGAISILSIYATFFISPKHEPTLQTVQQPRSPAIGSGDKASGVILIEEKPAA
jgi:hypothetical protein